jgi:hypothetical protein
MHTRTGMSLRERVSRANLATYRTGRLQYIFTTITRTRC